MINQAYIDENNEIIKEVVKTLKRKSEEIEFGSCSLILTYHCGKISKTEIQTAEAVKIEKDR